MLVVLGRDHAFHEVVEQGQRVRLARLGLLGLEFPFLVCVDLREHTQPALYLELVGLWLAQFIQLQLHWIQDICDLVRHWVLVVFTLNFWQNFWLSPHWGALGPEEHWLRPTRLGTTRL